MKLFKDFKRAKTLTNNEYWVAKSRYLGYYASLPIDEHAILLESEHGRKLDGNIFYLVKYLASSEEYSGYRILVSSMKRYRRKFLAFLDKHGIKNVSLVMVATDDYMRALASAKYIINDTTFAQYYMKKPGQIYINTWHGTPLKTLGKSDNSGFHNIGNVQRNFLSADYLLYPNEYMKEIMLTDYMLKNIAKGKTFLSGYPRNEVFFDKESEAKIREELKLDGKRAYAYMPTYRGSVDKGKTSVNTAFLIYYLYRIDKMLSDDEIFYVNLHPLASDDIDFRRFKKIRQFPKRYEVYEFLNAVDVLITDYSSVFFDFAPSGKKIILFPYDEEEYLSSRGMYMDIRELPFPRVYDEHELVAEMRADKTYDDTDFMNTYCRYESKDASKKLCDYFILGKETGICPEPIESNGKKNVVIYTGNLAPNGITASLRSLLANADRDKYNYYLTFMTEYVSRYRQTIREFPEGVNYIATTGDMNLSVKERIVRKLFKYGLISTGRYMKMAGSCSKYELIRKYADAKIDTLIQFNGYDFEIILSFSLFEGNNVIFVHSDMLQEAKTRGIQRLDVLKHAYNTYNSVAIVTEDMRTPTKKISGREDNIRVVKNTINHCMIREKGEMPVAYDSYTKSTVSEENLNTILQSDSKKFINVGRFSPEKGQDRLISAFAKYTKEVNSDAYLIIIGGRSAPGYYKMLINLSEQLGVKDRVILIERMSNPYAVVKACDGFVLSSKYEGFGLVIAEADILNVPVVSTDIPGPRGFMQLHRGALVEDSEDGIFQGICMLSEGLVKPLNVDYEAYNDEAVAQFESLLD